MHPMNLEEGYAPREHPNPATAPCKFPPWPAGHPQRWEEPGKPPQSPAHPSPAEMIRPAHVAQVQAVGLLLVLVGAGGDDGLSPALGARLVLAGAEEEAVGVLAGDAVEELAQSLVAFPAAAVLGGRDLPAACGDVARAQALAVVVQVAGFGRVQAVVAFGGGGGVHSCMGRKRRGC